MKINHASKDKSNQCKELLKAIEKSGKSAKGLMFLDDCTIDSSWLMSTNKCLNCGQSIETKGHDNCPVCGESIRKPCFVCGAKSDVPWADFCERCGSPILPIKIEVEYPDYCPSRECVYCGKRYNIKDSEFCPRCKEEPVKINRVCDICGTANYAHFYNFCPRCGVNYKSRDQEINIINDLRNKPIALIEKLKDERITLLSIKYFLDIHTAKEIRDHLVLFYTIQTEQGYFYRYKCMSAAMNSENVINFMEAGNDSNKEHKIDN